MINLSQYKFLLSLVARDSCSIPKDREKNPSYFVTHGNTENKTAIATIAVITQLEIS